MKNGEGRRMPVSSTGTVREMEDRREGDQASDRKKRLCPSRSSASLHQSEPAFGVVSIGAVRLKVVGMIMHLQRG